MKKFRFPLRPVAFLREHQQSRARDAFAVTVQALAKTEAALAAKRVERSDLEKLMNDERATFKAADKISLWDHYRRVCDDEKKAVEVVQQARVVMEEARQKYLEAHRAVKVVEKLEHKARTAHRLGVDREAQLESDELSGMRVARRVAESTVTS